MLRCAFFSVVLGAQDHYSNSIDAWIYVQRESVIRRSSAKKTAQGCEDFFCQMHRVDSGVVHSAKQHDLLTFGNCIFTWNPKQPFITGCFNWMIPNLYIGNGCFTKHPFINGCLGFQVYIVR